MYRFLLLLLLPTISSAIQCYQYSIAFPNLNIYDNDINEAQEVTCDDGKCITFLDYRPVNETHPYLFGKGCVNHLLGVATFDDKLKDEILESRTGLFNYRFVMLMCFNDYCNHQLFENGLSTIPDNEPFGTATIKDINYIPSQSSNTPRIQTPRPRIFSSTHHVIPIGNGTEYQDQDYYNYDDFVHETHPSSDTSSTLFSSSAMIRNYFNAIGTVIVIVFFMLL